MPTTIANKKDALILKYETDIKFSDRQKLMAEADDIWDTLLHAVLKTNATAAIISAVKANPAAEVDTNQSYDFVFERDAQGKWTCPELKSTPAKISYRAALKAAGEGHYKEAIASYTESIDADPTDAQALTDRGCVYMLQHEPAKAMDDLTKAIALNPENIDSWIDRAGAYGELKQYSSSIEDCAKAIALHSDAVNTSGAYANRGEAYYKTKEYERALADLTTAIQSHPQPAECYYYRALTYEKLGKTDLAKSDKAKAKSLGYREGSDTAVIEKQ